MCARFKARRTSHHAKPPTPCPAHGQHSPAESSREPVTPLPCSWAPQDRTEWLCNPPLSPPTLLHVSGAVSTRRVDFLPLDEVRLRPRPNLSPARPPSPPAELHGGGSLDSASAAAAAFLAAFLAALARSHSRVRAGSILGSRRTRGGPATPPPTRRGPPHRSTPAASAPHPLSTPLPSLTPPSPSISTSTQPHPPPPLAPLVIPPPSSSVQLRARPCGGPLRVW